MSNNQYFGLETFFNEDVKFFKDVYIYGKLYYEGDIEVRGQAVFKSDVYIGETVLTANTESKKVGIGSTNPEQTLDVIGNVKIDGFIYDSVNSPGANGFYLSMDEEGIRWTSGGGSIEVVDDTTTNSTYYVGYSKITSGNLSVLSIASSKLTFNPSTGNLSATTFTSLSDEGLKKNINVIENPIDKISTINGVTFDWAINGKPSIGLVAQEVEKVFPELVEGDDVKSVNYNGLVGVLIECVKDLQRQINILKNS